MMMMMMNDDDDVLTIARGHYKGHKKAYLSMEENKIMPCTCTAVSTQGNGANELWYTHPVPLATK